MTKPVKTIVVASHNPVKIEAALHGFQKMFPELTFDVVPAAVPSGVADQPMSDAETLQGALNRVNNACEKYPEASYWIGIEGGVELHDGELAAFAWVVVRSETETGKARSGAFYLPHIIAELVAQGMELGEADDLVFKQTNTKQQAGAIGLLTDGALGRRQLYEQAVVLALVRFRNAELYQQVAL
ncbi:MAG TPA: inosine/xanthosine triphosphatase [Pontibacter sp.]